LLRFSSYKLGDVSFEDIRPDTRQREMSNGLMLGAGMGAVHWCLFDFEKIKPLKQFAGIDAFCDEHGVINDTKPRVKWKNDFDEQEGETVVNCQLQFETLDDLEALIQMGFKEGFTAGLENLDQYIASQFYLRRKNKPNNKARVSTYVNFPGNTEEAFNFYKSVFKTEFVNGIKRFDELPSDPNHPPIAESVKKMVLHVELPILGGHILMATDSPKEMGFTVTPGNNMHINLETESSNRPTNFSMASQPVEKLKCRYRICSGVLTSEALQTSLESIG
jgi:PhnB protein